VSEVLLSREIAAVKFFSRKEVFSEVEVEVEVFLTNILSVSSAQLEGGGLIRGVTILVRSRRSGVD